MADPPSTEPTPLEAKEPTTPPPESTGAILSGASIRSGGSTPRSGMRGKLEDTVDRVRYLREKEIHHLLEELCDVLLETKPEEDIYSFLIDYLEANEARNLAPEETLTPTQASTSASRSLFGESPSNTKAATNNKASPPAQPPGKHWWVRDGAKKGPQPKEAGTPLPPQPVAPGGASSKRGNRGGAPNPQRTHRERRDSSKETRGAKGTRTNLTSNVIPSPPAHTTEETTKSVIQSEETDTPSTEADNNVDEDLILIFGQARGLITTDSPPPPLVDWLLLQ